MLGNARRPSFPAEPRPRTGSRIRPPASLTIDRVAIAYHVAYDPDANNGENYNDVEHAVYIRCRGSFATHGKRFRSRAALATSGRGRDAIAPVSTPRCAHSDLARSTARYKFGGGMRPGLYTRCGRGCSRAPRKPAAGDARSRPRRKMVKRAGVLPVPTSSPDLPGGIGAWCARRPFLPKSQQPGYGST
jgi:hypothetical protein